jgi:hypothetical protein
MVFNSGMEEKASLKSEAPRKVSHQGRPHPQSANSALTRNYTVNDQDVKDIPRTSGHEEHERGALVISDMLAAHDNVREGWQSPGVKNEIHQVYYDWLSRAAEWTTFITLTFKDVKPPDQAYKCWTLLVRVLNQRAFGSHYTEKVGHSYFNYIVGIESTKSRDVVHFHVLIDKPVDYKLVHSWWNKVAGFAWIERIKDKDKALHYVTKYCLKAGEDNVRFFLKSKGKTPDPLPGWWITE